MMKFALVAALLLGSAAAAQADLPDQPNGFVVNHLQLAQSEFENVAVSYEQNFVLASMPVEMGAEKAPPADVKSAQRPDTPWASTLLLLGVSLVGLGTTRRLFG